MTLHDYVISKFSTIRDSLIKIENNRNGYILITDNENVVVGIATDGDIRRFLLDGGNLDSQIFECANLNYIWADSETSRELILKQLDSHFKIIPLLDKNRK